MGVELKMPALSPTMEAGTLAKWPVKDGDTVSSGAILAGIGTHEATMESDAVAAGSVPRVLFRDGSAGTKGGRGRLDGKA